MDFILKWYLLIYIFFLKFISFRFWLTIEDSESLLSLCYRYGTTALCLSYHASYKSKCIYVCMYVCMYFSTDLSENVNKPPSINSPAKHLPLSHITISLQIRSDTLIYGSADRAQTVYAEEEAFNRKMEQVRGMCIHSIVSVRSSFSFSFFQFQPPFVS